MLISILNSTVHTGFSIILDTQGSLNIKVGTENKVEVVDIALKTQKKTRSKVKLISSGRSVQVSLTHKSFRVESIPAPTTFAWQLKSDALVFRPGPLFSAASQSNSATDHGRNPRSCVTSFFNGRIDRLILRVSGQEPSVLAKYDFSQDISSDRIIDVSGHCHNGFLVNAPTRAVTGHDWDGSECDSTQAKHGARSGVYAVEVETTSGRDQDSIPVFVLSTRWSSDNSTKVCLIFSTFTYLAYANERLLETSSHVFGDDLRGDLGLSLYDVAVSDTHSFVLNTCHVG